jgi:nitronate monooxygenase
MLQDLIDVPLPVIQAPMAGVQGSALAAAVCNGGGLGSLPCAMLSLERLREELLALSQQTERPFNVNFFCHAAPRADASRETAWRAALAPYYAELGIDAGALSAVPARESFSAAACELLEQFSPAVVSFHFGLPPPELMARLKRLGATVLSSATTVEEARWLERRGVDAIVAQGLEAGGHRGHFLSDDLDLQMGLFALLPQVIAAVNVPVIAAGGIADAQGVAAAMALGASAVQLGTAYLLCPEATTSAVHRAALQSDAALATALTNLFSGRPARGIINRLMRELGPMSPLAPDFPLAAAALAPLRACAEGQDSADFSPLWAGQNTMGCRAMPAAQLTQLLASQIPQAVQKNPSIGELE